MANGRAPLTVTLHAANAETASGTGTSVDLWTAAAGSDTLLPRSCVEMDLDVTSVSGTTPALAVTIEHSRDGTNWSTLLTLDSVTAVGHVQRSIAGAHRYVRARWTVTGTTPSFTFSFLGSALIVYATPAELDAFGLPAKAMTGVTVDQKAGAIRAASAMCDGRLPATKALPLSAWDTDLTLIVCQIAAWLIISFRGFNPDGADAVIRQRYEDAIGLLEKVATSKADLSGATDASPNTVEGGAIVYTRARRGEMGA